VKSDTYDQVFSDWSYLWHEYGPAVDMTGGYVDQDDLAQLLASPRKSTAKKCLTRQIGYWFMVGPDHIDKQPDPDDQRLHEIAERYGEKFP
jgi:hypothetical protein